MQSLLGYSLPTPVVWAVAFAIIFTLLAIFALVLRKLAGARLNLQGGAARGRQPRLGVVDAFSLDRQRQLVIVRRDNVEHLVLLGGPNDLLIESQILRGAPGSVQREPDFRAETPRPDLQRTDTPPMQAPPQPRAEMPPPPQPRVDMPPPRPAPAIAPAEAPKLDARTLAPRYEPPRPSGPPAAPPAAPPVASAPAPAPAPAADRYRSPPAPLEPPRQAVSAPTANAPTPAFSASAPDPIVRERLAPERPVPARTAPEISAPPAAPLHAVRPVATAELSEVAKRLDEATKRPVTDVPDKRSEANRSASPPPLRPVAPNFIPPSVGRPAMATLGELMANSEPKSPELTPSQPDKPTASPAQPPKPEPTVIRPEPDLASVFAQEERPAEPQQTAKRPEPVLPASVKSGAEAMDFDSLEAEMSRLLGRDPSARKD